MAELARWSLKVSRQTDIALRTLLATRGGKKGDLSRFIEDAVNREALRQMAQDIRVRNTDLQPDEIMRLVYEETSLVRPSFWNDRSN
ncbi:hypothetical protein H3V42_16435 [Sphingobium yanoikuyae]|uniref:XACb0070 ribbon-helix-helix domain-containing protein n=1 Tax=Sphingobium yanoikuyae TaxID=13690 RepID=A0A9X7UEX7_SPHYA|nr:hypothetical protein H3V42_16435 [Sphingobium yanoikuyae]